MIWEVVDLVSGLTVALLPLLVLAVPGLILLVPVALVLAVLAIPVVLVAGIVALPYLLVRSVRRRLAARHVPEHAGHGRAIQAH
jgi:hypothetical protein